ncbi:MAG TPA: hypothetical protein VF443_05640 [Nitrospira sp.]
MFQNASIDIAIGLILMYLVLSLMCTVINEFVATKLELRSKSLAAGLSQLLDDPVVRGAFYDHGLIAGTQNVLAKVSRISVIRSKPDTPALTVASPTTVVTPAQSGQHPSYISAETFVLALVGSLTSAQSTHGQQVPGFADVQSAIQNLPPSKIKSALLTSLIAAQGNFDAFRKSVATWFDDSMERLSGAYKRHLKLISIIVGCAVAVIFNADTFEVGKTLWSDGELRAQMIRAAGVTGAANAEPQRGEESAQPAGPPSQPAEIATAFKTANENLRPLPIGWPPCSPSDKTGQPARASGADRTCPTEQSAWLRFALFKIVGWFITGLALSLGAPFWFDTLSKFMNVRGSGAKPARQT